MGVPLPFVFLSACKTPGSAHLSHLFLPSIIFLILPKRSPRYGGGEEVRDDAFRCFPQKARRVHWSTEAAPAGAVDRTHFSPICPIFFLTRTPDKHKINRYFFQQDQTLMEGSTWQ